MSHLKINVMSATGVTISAAIATHSSGRNLILSFLSKLYACIRNLMPPVGKKFFFGFCVGFIIAMLML